MNWTAITGASPAVRDTEPLLDDIRKNVNGVKEEIKTVHAAIAAIQSTRWQIANHNERAGLLLE
jgi:hypothetical protein